MRVIKVIEYQNIWDQKFKEEHNLLLKTLGNLDIIIQHIGSTSIPGLAAKPIIDILLETEDINFLDAYSEVLYKIGYQALGEFGLDGRRFYQKGGDNRTHHIHAFNHGSFHIERHAAFRDYLKTHLKIANEYGALKKAAALSCQNDINIYSQKKAEFIEKHEKLALLWKRKINATP